MSIKKIDRLINNDLNFRYIKEISFIFLGGKS